MTVYLLKNKSDDPAASQLDPYEEAIDGAEFVPIMDYHTVDLDGLKDLLVAVEDYDGIVITSQRAVDAVRLILNDLPRSILEKCVYTVGPTTAKRLEGLRFKSIEGADSGNGQALASSMISRLEPNSRLLFLAGEVHRRELPDRLISSGHTVTTKIVYRTTRNSEIDTYLQKHAKPGDWIIFFSPSHADLALKFLKSSKGQYNIGAIGPTTQDFLTNAGFQVTAVAPTPTALGLKTAIEKAELQTPEGSTNPHS